MVIALSGGDILLFELLEEDCSQLTEVARRELGHEITCIDLSPSRQEKLLGLLFFFFLVSFFFFLSFSFYKINNLF